MSDSQISDQVQEVLSYPLFDPTTKLYRDAAGGYLVCRRLNDPIPTLRRIGLADALELFGRAYLACDTSSDPEEIQSLLCSAAAELRRAGR